MRTEADIKKYLFAEMKSAESEAFEDEMFADDELFVETADLENRLVDEFVAGRLPKVDLTRFENSLAKIPARREKVANARLIAEFIAEERPQEAVEEESESVWSKVRGLLTGRSPAWSLAMTAAVVVLALAAALLVLDNRRKNNEIASLQNRESRVGQLEEELKTARSRESELQTAIDSEREATVDFSEELDRERERRLQIEKELERLKSQPPPQAVGPIIASAVLSPLGARGGPAGSVVDLKIAAETRRVSLRLNLPNDVTSEDRLTVKVNQKPVAQSVAPVISAKSKSINITLRTDTLNKGKNQIKISDAEGRDVGDYGINAIKP